MINLKTGVSKQNPVLIDTETPIVVHIDSFGNMITNIGYSRLGSGGIMINDTVIKEISGTYDDIKGSGPALIKSSAGTIEVSSVPGQGAVFSVRLPLVSHS